MRPTLRRVDARDQFTSRRTQAVESELEHFPTDGLQLEVRTQDFPDRGPYSLEKSSGADLYIFFLFAATVIRRQQRDIRQCTQ